MNKIGQKKRHFYNQEIILNLYHEVRNEYGRDISSIEFCAHPQGCAIGVVVKHFGKWSHLVAAAGYDAPVVGKHRGFFYDKMIKGQKRAREKKLKNKAGA
jgi:predicted glycosyltransferase